MFALKAGQGAKAGRGADHATGAPSSVYGLVLPRWLRRPARMVSRMVSGEIEVPRFTVTALTAAFLSATGIYGAVLGGHMPKVVQAVTARSGFAIDSVEVTGNVETSEIDILQQIGLDGWTSLVGFDAEAARERIAELPWVAEASVRKIYPDAIEVRITERQPFAIWQHGRELSLVEASGAVIAPFRSRRHAMLPLVIGLGAATGAQEFLAKVEEFPGLASRVKAYIRVAERRWDLRLENGVTVKLPAGEERQALVDLVDLDKTQGLLSRDIAAVDMRLEDRLFIKLTPEAAMRRDATLKERTKGAVKPEKRV